MKHFIAVFVAILFVGSALAADPCVLKLEGPWAKGFSFNMEPNPPKLGQKVHIDASITIYDDVFMGTIKGYVQSDQSGKQFSFDRELCSIKQLTCPLLQGETRGFNRTLVVPSTLFQKGSLSLKATVLDDNDNLILDMAVDHCVIE